MTAPPLHGSHAGAYAIVRVETPGGIVEQPCDDEPTVAAVSVSLLAAVAEPFRSASTVTVVRRQPKEDPQ